MCKRDNQLYREECLLEKFLLEPDRNTRNFITETKWCLIDIYMEIKIKYLFCTSNCKKNVKLFLENVSKVTINNYVQ